MISSIPLIQELRSRNPYIPLFVSVSTVAGRLAAEEKLAQLVEGVFYAPLDYAIPVRRVLRRLRPSVLVVLETEIWPALYREVKRASCALIIVNGRISDRAFPRYRGFRPVFRYALAFPDTIFSQSESDAARYLQIGAPEDKVRVLGNLKYDAAPPSTRPPAMVIDLIAYLRPTATWIAASTMPPADGADIDEDDAVIGAFQNLIERHPGLLLILVPRKPERFEVAAGKLANAGIAFVRRSANSFPLELSLPCVLLLDSIGELAALFPLADIVFMGGTLARRGGHNILEPAICARPIITGPHMENFAAIISDFRAHEAVLQIDLPGELAGAIEKLLSDRDLRQHLGSRAAEVANQSRGAASKAAAEIIEAHDWAVPVWNQPGPSKPLLWLLSKVWVFLMRRDQAHKRAHIRWLSAPVISVGGISMGGTGKTPFVEWLAEKLHAQGLQPAILTRGYRRKSVEKMLVVPAGGRVPAFKSGDEPQIFIRSGIANVGIGADRWQTGQVLEHVLHTDVFLLDDGFQHWRLRRELDIVLIDALNPFAGGAVFPLGHLREPIEALRRAGAIVITRVQPRREYAGILARIRAVNTTAPVFRAQVEPHCWVNERTGQRVTAPPRPVIAFCGLANPESFWRTLAALDIQPLFRWAFDDHHHYTHRELRRLVSQAVSRRAHVILATEKDAMNLPEKALEIIAPLDLYWLKIGTQIEDETALLALIRSQIAGRPKPF